ncbi:hypothetical protein ACHAPU_000723 [Fusarium lateritium]
MVDTNATTRNSAETEISSFHTPDSSTPNTTTSMPPRQGILPERSPCSAVTSSLLKPKGLPLLHSSPIRATNTPEPLSSSLPDPPATPPVDISPDIGMIAQEAKVHLEGFFVRYQQIRMYVKFKRQELIESAKFLRSARWNLEHQRRELDAKKQKLYGMDKANEDLESVQSFDLQAREWLVAHPRAADESGQIGWMSLAQAKELLDSILITKTEVERLKGGVSTCEESIREMVKDIDTNVSQLKDLKHMCFKGLGDDDSNASEG